MNSSPGNNKGLFLSKLSILLVNFSIQIARVNNIQAEVRLIQVLCGKYLQAHSLPCKSWTSEHLTPIITCHCKNLEHWHKYLTWSNDNPWHRTTLWMLFSKWENTKTLTHFQNKVQYTELSSLTRISVRLPQDYHGVHMALHHLNRWWIKPRNIIINIVR